MTRTSDMTFKFDYKIEITKDHLTVMMFTPFCGTSKRYRFREVENGDYKMIEGDTRINPHFQLDKFYPYTSIKNKCDKWLKEVN